MGSSPLRRINRGRKLVKLADLTNIKSTKGKDANNSKQCLEDVNEDEKIEKKDSEVGGRKRKTFSVIRFKALFKSQRRRIESDDNEDLEVEDKSPQANTSRKEDVDKELKVQKSIKIQEAPDRDCNALLEEKGIDLEQTEHKPEGDKLEIKRRQHIPNVDASENHEYNENVSWKRKDAFENVNRERDEKRVNLENDYKVDKCFILLLYSNPSIRNEKLKILGREFANKLEEDERLWEIRLQDLKATMLPPEGQVSADHEFSSRRSHHETQAAPTLPENPIGVKSPEDPMCDGANDIGSTGSDTSEKKRVAATVSSEQNGEVPAQQLGDEMEVDVAEKVDSSHDVSHAVEDHRETGVNDLAPPVNSADVNCGDMDIPAGNYNTEDDEDGTLNLETSHVVENCRETVNGALEVESVETGTPDNEPDFLSSTDPTVAENPSNTLPPNGPLLEPIPEENLEENLVPAAESEALQEEHQARVATSVAPAPPVNPLNMFDNLINCVSPQTNPLQAEVERLYTVKDSVTKFHQETKQRLNSECKKEIAEIVAQINLKYEAKHQEADAAYNTKKMELETNINRVIMNRILAEAYKSKCQDLSPVSQVGLMQQLRMFSVPDQSSGNQQPPLRPRLQIVHQPADLFSSRLSPLNTTNFWN